MTRPSYRRHSLGLPAAIAAGALIAGCGGPKTSDRDIVLVGPTEAQALMADTKPLIGRAKTSLVIDPREEYEYRTGHIPAAVNIPYATLRSAKRYLDAYDVLIVYGNAYGSIVATAATKTLLDMGYKDVRTIDGGLEAWRANDLPTETGEGKPLTFPGGASVPPP